MLNGIFEFIIITILKQLLLVFFTALFAFANAQSPISIGINTSFDLTTQHPKPLFVKPWIGYQLGVKLKYDLNKNFALITGFNHQNQGARIDYSKLIMADGSKPKSGDIYEKISQVPLMLSYYTGSKVRFGFNIGMAYNFLYRVNANVTFQNEEILSFTSTSSNQFITGLFSFGAEYTLNRTTFRVEPNVAYKFIDMEGPSPNYFNVGLGASVYYRLK